MNSVVQVQILTHNTKNSHLLAADKVHHRRSFWTPHLFINLFPSDVHYLLLSEMKYWIEDLLVLHWQCFSVVIIDLHLHCLVTKLWFVNSIQIQIFHKQEYSELLVMPSVISQRCSHCCTNLRRQWRFYSKEINSKELNSAPFSEMWNFFSTLLKDLAITSLITWANITKYGFIQWCCW